MEGFDYIFTVFTPTFNRSWTLPRVYESLEAQTFRDFEWLVVDDGSSDGTGELVEGWRRRATFPVRYLYQENAGKHVAFNRAVREARGALFLTLDSDDACVPRALERLLYWWESIPQRQRQAFSAVTALCQDASGNLVGSRFPQSPLDCTSIELDMRYRVKGEKWGFQRTDVLLRHPFPEPEGVPFVPESLVWRAIDRDGYRTRFVNEALRTYWFREAGKADLSSLSPLVLPGRLMAHAQTLNDFAQWFWVNPAAFVKAAVNLSRYGLLQGWSIPAIVGTVRRPGAKFLVAACLPLGAIFFARDRRGMRPDGPLQGRRHGRTRRGGAA